MTANPLAGRVTATARVTLDHLRDYAEQLNAMAWVRDSGSLYFVNSRADGNGVVSHYLDRHA